MVEGNVTTDMQPELALSTWATASKIAAEYPDEGADNIGDAERAAASAYLRKVVRAVIGLVQSDPAILVTDQLIDSVALTASASDNSSYVNCTSPPATELAPIETTATKRKRKA